MTIPTTHTEALAVLRAMMIGAQRSRSISIEMFGTYSSQVQESMNPWLFGPQCILPTLIEAVQRAEAGGDIRGADLMNLCYIATASEPTIALCAINISGDIIPDWKDTTSLVGRIFTYKEV